jgi:putrescine importer
MSQSGGLKRSLGLWAIVGLGLGYMTPTVLFDTFGIVTKQTHGVVPLAYLVALVVMIFTAISYGRMAAAHPVAGSAYTYTRKAIDSRIGFLVGWFPCSRRCPGGSGWWCSSPSSPP